MIAGKTAALALALILAATPAMAQSARVLGDFRDWSSFAADDGSGTICFAMTKPKSSEPAAEGQAYLYITNRPGEDVVGEFNVVAGYTFQTGSVASVNIGGQNFALFTQGDAAWLDDSGQSTALGAAIRAGSSLTIEGTNATGARVVQSYSLSGATAAQQAIGAEC